jgi:hypothetical protein
MNKINLVLNIRTFAEGICFLCGKECEKEAYLHIACSQAYYDEKEKRIKEAQKIT